MAEKQLTPPPGFADTYHTSDKYKGLLPDVPRGKREKFTLSLMQAPDLNTKRSVEVLVSEFIHFYRRWQTCFYFTLPVYPTKVLNPFLNVRTADVRSFKSILNRTRLTYDLMNRTRTKLGRFTIVRTERFGLNSVGPVRTGFDHPFLIYTKYVGLGSEKSLFIKQFLITYY